MTKIKLCGLSRTCDILATNELKPEYIGFVFAPKSKRWISPKKAAKLKKLLDKDIQAVGVFVDESLETVAHLLNSGIIDIAQLHGHEDEEDICRLRRLTCRPIIRAFCIREEKDVYDAEQSSADRILLDSGAGTGTRFDWKWLLKIKRPYFLAGGLSPENVGEAVKTLHPYGVDVSSGIEIHGEKDKCRMAEFIAAVRKEDNYE